MRGLGLTQYMNTWKRSKFATLKPAKRSTRNSIQILYRDAASFILGGVEFEACRESGVACNMGLGGSRSSDSTAA
jgi:hypothetical protein